MTSNIIQSFAWIGYDAPHLDKPTINTCGSVVVGSYGGNKAAGATKNEDGAWCLTGDDWQLGMILDAHASSESVTYIVELFNTVSPKFKQIMSQELGRVFRELHQFVIGLLSEQNFSDIQGEASILLCAQKGGFLWWFCIGDNPVYLLHPDLMERGQCALNQRSFYEWIGAVNTFDLPVACYSSGVRELRQGKNRIIMTTDGLLECGSRFFEQPHNIYEHFTQQTDLKYSVQSALETVHVEQGVDSATIIAWTVENERAVSYPSG